MAQTQNIGIVCVYPRGAWSGTTAYKKLSLVTYNNAAYIATQDNVGIEPSVSPNWSLYWMLLLNNPNPEEITVDAAISYSSENPVQNKVIAQELGFKFDKSGGYISGDVTTSGKMNIGGALSALSGTFINGFTANGISTFTYFAEGITVDPQTKTIKGLVPPVNDDEAANKEYVDEQIGNLTTATQAIIALQENYINGGGN